MIILNNNMKQNIMKEKRVGIRGSREEKRKREEGRKEGRLKNKLLSNGRILWTQYYGL